MRPLAVLASAAAELQVPLSMVAKSEMGREVLRHLAAVDGLVLQGGGALHHVFGSPRFSADLDYARQAELDRNLLAGALAQVAAVVSAAWAPCTAEVVATRGRLQRHRLRVRVDPGTSLVLSIETYEVPVHQPEIRDPADRTLTFRVRVESPAEIVADKVVASIDRFRSRGAMRLRDVFDIAFLLDLDTPPRALVEAKLADYGYGSELAPLRTLAGSLDVAAAERLRAELQDVLPRPHLAVFDPAAAVARVKALFEGLSR